MMTSLRDQCDMKEIALSNNEAVWLGNNVKDLANISLDKKGSSVVGEVSTPIYDNGKMVLPPAVANPDEVSPEEVDAFLTNELTQLSMDERDQIAQELHCITEPIQEEPAFVSKCFSDLQHELKMLPSADMTAYRKAHSIDPSCTTDRSFRLQFLRAERFNAKAAASRLARYFQEKLHLFGPEKVAKSITLGDLAEDDMSTLTSGFFQSCPCRDRSGRAILFVTPALENFKDLTSLARSVFYFLSAVLESEETQKRGVVIVCWVGGFESAIATKRSPEIDPAAAWKMSNLIGSMPIRVEGAHVCCDKMCSMVTINLAKFVIGRNMRLRSRCHHGTAVETRYALMSFGIGTIPAVTELGDLTLEPHQAWVDERRKTEAQEGYSCPMGPPVVSTVKCDESRSCFLGENDRPQQSDRVPSPCIVSVPSPNDVLFGNRQLVHVHAGNARYKALVESYRDEYEQANKVEKTKIAKEIILRIKDGGGRFLKQAAKKSDDDGSKRPTKRRNRAGSTTIGWVVVSDVQAREKIAHAFRNLRARAPKIPSTGHCSGAGASLAAGQGTIFGNNYSETRSTWDRCDCIGGADGSVLPSSTFFNS